MEIDCCARVVSIFQGIHKLFGDLLSKRHVIAAASPYPPFTTCTNNNAHAGYFTAGENVWIGVFRLVVEEM